MKTETKVQVVVEVTLELDSENTTRGQVKTIDTFIHQEDNIGLIDDNDMLTEIGIKTTILILCHGINVYIKGAHNVGLGKEHELMELATKTLNELYIMDPNAIEKIEIV